MGTTTPYIGIFIPAAGEDGYDQSFAAGMINIDQHDHSGGPNKGLPIATKGLANGAVTFDKLNANVVDQSIPGSGIGVSGAFPNQLVLLDPLKSIFQLAPAGVGFLTLNGNTASVRTFQNSPTVTWTNGNGTGGDPVANVNVAGISPVGVVNGGTGLTSLTPNAILVAGTTTTGNVQQVAPGIAGQALISGAPGFLPTWQNVAPQTVFLTAIVLNAAQFTSLGANRQILIPAFGAGVVPVIYKVWGKLNFAGTDPFHGGGTVKLFFGNSTPAYGFQFASLAFKDGTPPTPDAFYYYADDVETASSTGLPRSDVENTPVKVGLQGFNYSGGAGNSVVIWCAFSLMAI